MSRERWERVQELFIEAGRLPSEERAAFLDDRCGTDDDLRRDVSSLVAAEDAAAGAGGAEAVEDFIWRTVRAALPREEAGVNGRRIGAWVLRKQIGSGGMGVVYEAERADADYEQTVALKLLRSAFVGEHDVRRFALERRVLAGLEHPGIARLLDGGEAPDATPYLVMEYVRGEPIDSWCNTHTLDTRARVRLFLRVCDAVSYAHRNLVVHRDLKPSNILVTSDASPKLVDFGIAKLLEGPDGTGGATGTEIRSMTPAYASPEQVSGRPIGVGSDVYSLGVVLYELLTGRRPYDIPTRSQSEVIRVVCTEGPRRPSEHAEGSSGPGAGRVLRGDLDTVILHALRKEPERRYGSVSEFAEDLHRWLERRPVRARSDTWRYRAGKFVSRNRLGVSVGVLVTSALVAATAVSSHFAAREKRQRTLAEARFEDVRTLATTFLVDVDDALLGEGKIAARRIIVAKGLEYLDRLTEQAAGDSTLLRDLASGYVRIALIQGGPYGENLGQTSEAIRSVRKGREIAERLLLQNPGDTEIGLIAAGARLHNAALLEHEGDPEAIEPLFASALALREDLNRSGTDPLREPRTDKIVMTWALGLEAKASYQEAAARYEDAIARLDTMIAKYPDSETLVADRLNVAGQLGQVHQRRGDWAAVVECLEPIRDRLLSEAPKDRYRRVILASARANLGRAYDSLERRPEALEELTAALEINQSLVDGDPEDRGARRRLSLAHHWLGLLRDNEGNYEAAHFHMGEMLRLRRAIAGENPESALHRRDLAVGLDLTGNALRKLGRNSEALESGLQANRIFRELADEDPTNHAARRSVAVSCYYLGLLRQDLAEDAGRSGEREGRRRHLADARTSFSEARAIMEKIRDDGGLPPGDEQVIEMLAGHEAKAAAALAE